MLKETNNIVQIYLISSISLIFLQSIFLLTRGHIDEYNTSVQKELSLDPQRMNIC